MKRENILITEDYATKRVAAVKFIAPGNIPFLDCSIHFSEEGNDVTIQNCIIKDNNIVKCSPEDTYDFETGALIALMKMCGRDKVIKACDELYKDDNYKNALQEVTENNEKLIEENNHLKYVKSCNESTIESLENTRDLHINKNNELIEENKKLQHENDLCKCSEKALKCSVDYLNKTIAKLNKEAYNTKLPVWQKEALNQMYGKPRTKREEMWENIFELHKESDVIIKVKKEDVNSFLHEIEKRIPEIIWMSTVKIFETKYTIGDIYEELKTCDTIYFRLSKINTLSYSSDSHIYPYRDLVQITYLPPMRWDLFKNGRIVVACTEEEVPEFREKVVREFGNIRMEKYSIENLHCNGPIRVYFHYNKDTNWLKPLLVSGIPRVKVNNHKVVYWEDVR